MQTTGSLFAHTDEILAFGLLNAEIIWGNLVFQMVPA